MKVYQFGDPAASRILIQPVDDHDLEGIHREAEVIQAEAGTDFCLLAVKIEDWNRELSPWAAPPVFGSEAFGGEAEKTLAALLALCADPHRRFFLGGYSLAGLFALWAVCRTDRFAGAAAASPSVWFPGFADYLAANPPLAGHVYLSLGDREEKTRNPVMATVGDRIRDVFRLLQDHQTVCTLEWNPGNHFRDADLRTGRAFSWLLNTSNS